MRNNISIYSIQPPPQKPNRGFTLIEMLVVIAIIGLLSSILVPAVTGALTRAKSTACKSNLRQIYIAEAAYAVDHDGWTTGARNEGGGGGPLAPQTWMGQLAPYMGMEAVRVNQSSEEEIRAKMRRSAFWCPSLPPLTNFQMRGYAQNQFVGAHISPKKITNTEERSYSVGFETTSTLGTPSDILFFSDTMIWPGGWGRDGIRYYSNWNGNFDVYPAQRHRGKANILSLAGNVVSIGPLELSTDLIIFGD